MPDFTSAFSYWLKRYTAITEQFSSNEDLRKHMPMTSDYFQMTLETGKKKKKVYQNIFFPVVQYILFKIF